MRSLLALLTIALLEIGCVTHPEGSHLKGVQISGGKLLSLTDGPYWNLHSTTPVNPTFGKLPDSTDSSLIDARTGLAGYSIQHILELSDGRVAFATNSGLSFWDGHRVANYTEHPFDSLRNSIQDVEQDSKGRLWVATPSGVCLINGNSWQSFSAGGTGQFVNQSPGSSKIELPTAFALSDVSKVFTGAAGQVVLGSRCSGITLVGPNGDTAKTIYHDDDINHCISAISADSTGKLWLADRRVGLLCYDGHSLRVFDHSNSSELIPDDDVSTLCVGYDDSLWFASTSGLIRLRPDGVIDRFTAGDVLPGKFISQVFVDRSGAVWVMTDQGAAVYRNGWAYPVLPTELLLWCELITMDHAGRIWIGGKGAMRISNVQMVSKNPRETRIAEFKQKVEQRYPALPDLVAASKSRAARDSTGQIVAYESGRFFCYDGKNWRDMTSLLHGCDVWNLQSDKQGRVWVCTGGAGLIGIRGKEIERYNDDPEHSKSCIYNVAEASNGDLYVGTQYGLWRLKGKAWQDLSQSTNEIPQAIRVVVDRQDRVWVEDANFGVFVFENEAFTHLEEFSKLRGKEMQDLRLTPQGNIEVDAIDELKKPATIQTYRWLAGTPLLQPILVDNGK
jgi:ligand-binding sensor domain-containing protein